MLKTPRFLGLDIETAKIPNHIPWGAGFYLSTVSLSYPDNTEKTWVFYHDEVEKYDFNKNISEIQADIDKYDYVAIHNAKFDVNVLRQWLTFKNLWCTQVAEYLLRYHSNKELSLDLVAQSYGLKPKLDKVKMLWDSGLDTHEVPLSILTEYCQDDSKKHRVIAEKQWKKIYRRGLQKVFHLQMEWLNLLSVMECNGFVWDQQYAEKIVKRYTKLSNTVERRIKHYARKFLGDISESFNYSSNDDLSVLIYGGVYTRKEKVPKIRTKNIKTRVPYIFTYKNGTKVIKTKWVDHPDTKVIRRFWGNVEYEVDGLGVKPIDRSQTQKSTKEKPFFKTDVNTLEKLLLSTIDQKRIIKLIIKKSALDKVVSTLYNKDKKTGLMSKVRPEDGRIHATFNQTVTATGRLSSSDPNGQNLPRGNTSPIKECIIPEFDGIMNGDISQIELRTPAQLAQDKEMMREFIDGEDLHSNGCTQIMKLPLTKINRFYAKTFNFRMIYGGTEWGFFHDHNMPSFSLTRWKKIIENFFKKYCGLKKWQDDNIQHVIDGDGTLTLFTGRTYKFRLNWQGKYDERKIKNYPVQGTAGGDLMPLASVIIYREMQKRKMKSKLVLTVHDSLVADYIEDEKEELANIMLNTFNNLPKYIRQYWGYNWVVPITGEIEIGPNYGNMKRYK